MRLRLLLATTLALAACSSASTESSDSSTGVPVRSALGPRPVVSGLDEPVGLAAPRSEPNRLYVVEQGGRIRVVDRGRLRAAPFLDVADRISTEGSEQGLLGLAFHPSYARNRRFYVNYTDTNGHTNVVEYRSNGTRALPGTARRLLFVEQPYSNHNGGGLAFGPDGRLWVGMGDGGAGGDPENRAQNPRSRLGKMLTIDVDRPARVRMAALGLRNPWRFAFDRANRDLYIADVGQNALEEINYTPRSRLGGLLNYGWDVYEGRSRFEDKPLGPGRLVQPVAQYGRADGSCSVTGGVVYRGKVRALQGRYFYGDYCSGNIWSLKVVGGKARTLRKERFQIENVTSFAEDAAGELFAVSHRGTLYRLTP